MSADACIVYADKVVTFVWLHSFVLFFVLVNSLTCLVFRIKVMSQWEAVNCHLIYRLCNGAFKSWLHVIFYAPSYVNYRYLHLSVFCSVFA